MAQMFCTFRLGDLSFGVEAKQVQEVLFDRQLTRVPLAPPEVRGLLNLRGQIVPALDLRRRLGLPPAQGDRPPMNVVIRLGDGPVSFLVDEIGEVIEVNDADFEPPPETLTGEARRLIRGAYKLDDRLLLALAANEVANLAVARP